jgi:putative transposase
MTPEMSLYHRYRFPAEITSHAVRLYDVFSLSLRESELIPAERGVIVTHESIRNWCKEFGTEFAKRVRRRLRLGDTWHVDEVLIRIGGVLHYLWRAVDQHGVVLDILAQEKRDGAATKRFFEGLLIGLQHRSRRLITDGPRSCGVAQRAPFAWCQTPDQPKSRQPSGNLHQLTPRRERQMQRFKSPGQAQNFLSAHAIIYSHFRPRRHHLSTVRYRCARMKGFRIWRQETSVRQME